MTSDNTKTNENQNNPLGYENEAHLLTTFAIPCIISMLVTALYNIVDQIFIGHGVGMLGNAATNIAFPLSTACTAISLLLGIGSATSFSLKLGAGDEKKSAEATGNGICLMAIFGVALFLVTTIFLTPMLKAFGATDKVLPFAQEYTRITAIGFPFLIANTGMSKLIMADGSPRYSMISMLTGAIINTILDPILIFGLDMGMRGAALATITGQIISFAISLRYMFHFKTIHLTRESFVMRGEPCGNIFRFGASACFNQIAMAIVQVVMNNTLSRYGAQSVYGGDIPLACSGIISKVNMIFMAIVIGISQGTQPVTSNFFNSIGKARLGVFMSLTRQILFLLPLIIIFPIFMGIDGVMYAGPIADGITAIVCGVFTVRELKELTSIDRDAHEKAVKI